jgi:hypothetical protein
MRRVLIIATFIAVGAGVAAMIWRPLSVFLSPAAIAGIEDASRPIDVTLRAPPELDAVYALDVVAVGRIEGDAEISLVLNGAPYKTRHISGPVLFTWGGDWYGPEAIVRYTPSADTSGSMTLNYRFRSL